MPTPSLAELIGPLLGSAFRYAEGSVEVDDGTSVHRERFWTVRGDRWRVERDDGLVFVTGAARGSASLVRGVVRERGPALGEGSFAADHLLRPRTAGIWGRPGEDWRLSDRIEAVAGGLVRIELEPVETRWPGHCLVDPGTGFLHELVTGPRRATLLRVEQVPPPGLDVEALLALPAR